MLARLATERHAREQAAADLRQLHCLAAAVALAHGGSKGAAHFNKFEAALLQRANGKDQNANDEPEPQRRRRIRPPLKT